MVEDLADHKWIEDEGEDPHVGTRSPPGAVGTDAAVGYPSPSWTQRQWSACSATGCWRCSAEGLLSQERIELLLSWRHSGFSAHNAVTVGAGDTATIERLGRYLLRSPVAVERLTFDAGAEQVLYWHKGGSRLGGQVETFEPAEFLVRFLQHVPQPRFHEVWYYERYSNVARAQRNASAGEPEQGLGTPSPPDAGPDAAERSRLRRLWARLIRRVYEVDPLLCQDCGGTMRVLAFILDPGVVRKILAHLSAKGGGPGRAPPAAQPSSSSLAS